MKQKRFLPLFASGALLLATSCSSDDVVSGGSGDVATVTFTVSQSASAQSRSFSDGYTATELMCGVYSSEGTYIMEKSATFASGSLTTDVSFDLAKGNSYRIAFWAQSSSSPYSVSFENNSVTYTSSSSLEANSDNYDAFYNYYETGTVTGDASDKVTLTRPFAQINFGTDDKDAYETTFDQTLSYTKVVVSGVPTSFNLYNGTVNETTSDYTFGYAAIPSSETFPYSSDDITYTYTAMSYVFASDDQQLVNATLYYSSSEADETGEDGNTHCLTVSNIPIQSNYQTNIYGSLLKGNFETETT